MKTTFLFWGGYLYERIFFKTFLDSSNFYSIIIYFHLAMYAFIIIASLSLIISVILAIFSKNR